MTMLSFKLLELVRIGNYSKKEPCQWACSWIIKLLIVWVLDTVNILLFLQFELKTAVHATLTNKKNLKSEQFFYKKG